ALFPPNRLQLPSDFIEYVLNFSSPGVYITITLYIAPCTRRTITYLFAPLLFPFTLWGQVSVSADPTSFVLNGQPGELDIAYHISITNTSNQAGQIYWSIRMTNNPNNWLTWICDKNLCYTPDITSCPGSKPNVLAAGETIDFQVHMNPQNTEGTANYEIKIL